MPNQPNNQPNPTPLAFIICIVVAGSIWLGLSLGNQSLAQGQLPPRPTLTPTATPIPPATATPASPTATPFSQPVNIRLVVGPVYQDAWSLVQWLDTQGDWHDVTGWLGQIEGRQVQWRVLPKDYDTGPFRWLVIDAPGGTILAASKPFTLPNPLAPILVIDELSPAGLE